MRECCVLLFIGNKLSNGSLPSCQHHNEVNSNLSFRLVAANADLMNSVLMSTILVTIRTCDSVMFKKLFLVSFCMCPVTSEKCRPAVQLPSDPLEEMAAIVEPK